MRTSTMLKIGKTPGVGTSLVHRVRSLKSLFALAGRARIARANEIETQAVNAFESAWDQACKEFPAPTYWDAENGVDRREQKAQAAYFAVISDKSTRRL
jgi:hypothetical protein